MTNVIYLLILPFLGTTIGAASVFFLKDKLNQSVQKMFLGFAAGVMVAASVWSLIIPAINQCEDMGKLAFIPASVGLVIGFAFLLLLDKIIPHIHVNSNSAEGPKSKLGKSIMLFLAVTLHNIPEGMAVGVTAAAMLSGESGIGMAAAFSLALGIAIQNFPEGAILSLPLKEELNSKKRAFFYGAFSGIVEPLAALLTIACSFFIIPILPYLLAFAAGAMLYVVVEELIPEASQGEHTNISTISFAFGFILMMILDVALG
jgi:ZIP family zinc transporter